MSTLGDREKSEIEAIVAARGKELVDINVRRDGRMLIIEVLADNPEGGITLDDCVQLNRAIGDFFERNDTIEGDYAIEVNSPGIDRPLKTEKDFRRMLNREIRCHLKELVEGKMEHVGQLTNVVEGSIILKTKQGTVVISINLIQKAVQNF